MTQTAHAAADSAADAGMSAKAANRHATAAFAGQVETAFKDNDRIAMHRGLRSILIESSEDELREAFAGTGEDLDALAARGKAAAERALAEVTGSGTVT